MCRCSTVPTTLIYAREFMNERPLRCRTDDANGLPFSARRAPIVFLSMRCNSRGVDDIVDYRTRGVNCPSSHLQSEKRSVSMKILAFLARSISKEIDRLANTWDRERLGENHFRNNKMWGCKNRFLFFFLRGFHINLSLCTKFNILMNKRE